MTDEHKDKHEENEASDNQEARTTADRPPMAASAEEIQETLDRLAAAEAKAAENLDGWQRALAEFQNFKKRIERDRLSDQVAMKADLIRKILPILDDLERALENRPGNDAWVEGIDLIRRKLQALLEAEGIKRIEAEGAMFDPNLHEAIAQEPVAGAESGRVVAVMQQGYMLGDRVIRPAQVRVAA